MLIAERLEKVASTVSRSFNWVAGVAMVAMLAGTVADVIGIKVFKNSVPGGMDMVDLLGIVVTGFAIAYTRLIGGHIRVELILNRLPKRAHAGLYSFAALLGLALFVFLTWQSFAYGQTLRSTGEVSMTNGIPLYPFAYALALACIPVCIVLVSEFLSSLLKAVAK